MASLETDDSVDLANVLDCIMEEHEIHGDYSWLVVVSFKLVKHVCSQVIGVFHFFVDGVFI